MNSQPANASVLLVNVETLDDDRRDEFMFADSGRAAIELTHMLDFDLLVVGSPLPDLTVGELIRRIRRPNWALVAPELCADDEIEARSLGAVCVFDETPSPDTLLEMAGAMRRRPGVARAAPQSVKRQLASSSSH